LGASLLNAVKIEVEAAPMHLLSLPVQPAGGSSRRGFTLIELLTVIAIIGILAAILIPTLGRVRESSRTAAGLSNLREIGVALQLYALSNQDRLPYSFETNASGAALTDWALRLSAQYLASGLRADYPGGTLRNPIFQDPNAKIKAGPLHFSAHPILMPNSTAAFPPARLSSITRPAQLVLVMDGAQDPNTGGARASAGNVPGITTRYESNVGGLEDPVPMGPNVDNNAGLGHIRWRVSNDTAAKFLFCDGHVKVMKHGELKNRHIRAD
jgi:prepilin-type N-terminal cleavage/methylation domain-containing protein/prepilin-type processing-associated H-X9-DG protein